MVYKEVLIGKKLLINGQEIEILDNENFDRWIQFTENKLAGGRRAALKKIGDLNHKLPYEDITKKYFTAEDVLRNMKSTYSVFDKHQRQEGNKPENIKINDIKKMDFSENPLIGYEEVEQKNIQKRLDELSQEFNLEKSTDKFLARRVALCELKITQLEALSSMNPKEATECRKQIVLLDNQYKVFCDSLNILKRQRDNTKTKPDNKGTIADQLNEIEKDKSIEELQIEVKNEEEEEMKMLERRKNK